MTSTPPAIEPEDYRRLVGFKLLLLALLGAAAFLNSLYGAFLFEDESALSRAVSGKAWFSPTGIAGASLALNYALSGDHKETWSYHLLNIALHTLSALALYGVVCRTLIRQHARPRLQEAAPWLTFLIALLWLAHPLNTETADYLSRRGDLLAGLFYFVTLYCVIRGAEGERRLLWYSLAVFACLLGMGSALTMVTAPLVVLLYDRIFLAESWRDLWRRRAGLYAGFGACWALFAVAAFLAGFRNPDVSPLAYALAQPGVILHDLGLVFFPLGICFDYFDWPLNQPAGAYVLPFIVVGALLAATVGALFRYPKIGFLGAWFFLTLAPTSLIPQIEPAGDYRMYLPLAAVIVAVVLAGFALIQGAGERALWMVYAAVGVALVVVGALAFLTFQRNAAYEDPLAIWEDTIAKRPGDELAQTQLTRLGNLYLGLSKSFVRANDPDKAKAAVDKAEQAYRAAARASPDPVVDTRWFNEFGYRLWINGLPAEAAPFFQEAVRLEPEAAKYHFNLALALLDKGDKEEAEKHRQEGLKLDPGWPESAREEAWHKATDPEPANRNAEQAIFLARQACQSDTQKPEAWDALAAAYAAAGHFEEAAARAEQARQLADAQHEDKLSHDIQERISLYKAHHPFYQKQGAP